MDRRPPQDLLSYFSAPSGSTEDHEQACALGQSELPGLHKHSSSCSRHSFSSCTSFSMMPSHFPSPQRSSFSLSPGTISRHHTRNTHVSRGRRGSDCACQGRLHCPLPGGATHIVVSVNVPPYLRRSNVLFKTQILR